MQPFWGHLLTEETDNECDWRQVPAHIQPHNQAVEDPAVASYKHEWYAEAGE